MAFSGLQTRTLGEHINLLTGFPFSSANYTDDPMSPRLLRGDNVVQKGLRWDNAKHWPTAKLDGLAEYHLQPGDVVVAMDRPWIEAGLKCARILVDDVPTLLVQRVARLRTRNTLDQRFLYYLITSSDFTDHVLSVQTGTSVPHISGAQIKEFEFAYPRVEEQRWMARILGTLDDKIELNRRMNQTLEALARAIFKSWFVDFDPVVAKAAGRQPAGMNAETAALCPSEFEDSALGAIPKGSRVGQLCDMAEVIMGTSPSGDTYNDTGEGLPLINGPVEYGDFFPVKQKWTTSPGRLCKADDLIFCVRGSTTGRRVVADDVYCLGRGVCAIRARHGDQGFVDLAVEVGLDDLLTSATGSTFPSLNGPEIKSFQLVLSPREIVAEFGRLVDPMRTRVRRNVVQSGTLAALRDALLPRLLSGELRVKMAEKVLAEAAR